MTTLQRSRTASRLNPAGWITDGIVALLVMNWWKRLACVGAMAVALIFVTSITGHAFSGWSFRFWGPRGLPSSAAERAPLFVQAWLAQDHQEMMRFIRPADEAKLRAWIAANPVPTAVADMSPSDRKIKTIAVQRDDTDEAMLLKVRIADRAASDDPKGSGGFVQRQVWFCSGGDWLFACDTPPAPTAGPSAMASYPANARSSGMVYSAPRPQPRSDPDDDDRPPLRPGPRPAGNVVIPSTVPPWARGR